MTGSGRPPAAAVALLEICANSHASALAAQEGGADRVELCRDLRVGGLTPDPSEIQRALRVLSIPSHVLIRPRAGDFVYTQAEFALILDQIRFCGRSGAAGVVTGCLAANGEPDMERMARVMEAAGGMHVTFHRAFDQVPDPIGAMDRLASIGVGRILTSGGRSDAMSGADALAAWVAHSAGRIEIMPGGGIRVDNLALLHQVVGAGAYHGSLQGAPTSVSDGAAEGRTDPELVRLAVGILRRDGAGETSGEATRGAPI